jgi:hypothetical protein
MQNGGVIEYSLGKLKQHEELYATNDLELAVVMLDMKLWRNYLVGKIFDLKTNKASLHSNGIE